MVWIDIASLGISNIAFAIRRCFCVTYMATLIFLSCKSKKKSMQTFPTVYEGRKPDQTVTPSKESKKERPLVSKKI